MFLSKNPEKVKIKGMPILRKLFYEALEAANRRKNLIFFFIATHVVFLFFGQWLMSRGMPGVLALREELLNEIKDLPYLKPLVGPLATSLLLKIIYTFIFNLVFGAFLSTTITGIVFFVPYVMAVWRSLVIGVLFYGLHATPLDSVVFYGTALCEFVAYSLSAAVGTDIGLSIIFPGRKETASRKEAFRAAVREGMKIYVLVMALLFLGAVWEISWLHYLGPLIKPEDLLLSGP